MVFSALATPKSRLDVALGAGLACFFLAGMIVYENWPAEDIYSEVPKELTGRKSAHDFIWHNAVPLKQISGGRLASGGIVPGLDYRDNVDRLGGFREEFSFRKFTCNIQGIAVIALVLGGGACLAALVVRKGQQFPSSRGQ